MHVSFVRPHSIYMNKKCINHAVWEPWALSHRHQRCNKQQSRRWKHHGFTAPKGYVIYFALSKSLISCSHVWKIRITKKNQTSRFRPPRGETLSSSKLKSMYQQPPEDPQTAWTHSGVSPYQSSWMEDITHICLLLASAHGVNEWSSWCLKQIWSWCILRTGIRIVPEEKFLILPSTGTLR